MHEVKRTLSNQVHWHKSMSGTIFTTNKILLNSEVFSSLKTNRCTNSSSNEWLTVVGKDFWLV